MLPTKAVLAAADSPGLNLDEVSGPSYVEEMIPDLWHRLPLMAKQSRS